MVRKDDIGNKIIVNEFSLCFNSPLQISLQKDKENDRQMPKPVSYKGFLQYFVIL